VGALGNLLAVSKNRWTRRISLYVLRPLAYSYYRFRYAACPDPHKDLLVEPNRIEAWCRGNIHDRIAFPGQISGGDWHVRVTPKSRYLEENLKYKAMFERFHEGKPWSETSLFRDHFAKIPRTRSLPMRAGNLTELEEKYEETYDRLFDEIKTTGFRSAHEGVNPLYVCIGPQGGFYYTVDGNHRLAMAIVLKLDRIPVRVLRRHQTWQLYRERLLRQLQRGEISVDDVRKMGHPDLDDLGG
jgi:hypothetical protein